REESQHKNQIDNENLIQQIDPCNICRWRYKDRPDNELGNIDELAADLKQNGQIQPIILRQNTSGTSEDYELIIGERRWRAAKLAHIKLKAMVWSLSDKESAILQAAENEKRKDISDYAKGISYKRLIDEKIVTVKDLEIQLNKSQSYIRNVLS